MTKIIDFPDREIDIENLSITVQRTGEFYLLAQELSTYIAGLPLNRAQNDNLVYMIIDQVAEAERGALMQGFKMGAEVAQGLTQDKH